MKKYLLNFTSLFIAIILSSTTTKPLNCNPNTEYIWYYVTDIIACSNYASVTASQVTLFDHNASSCSSTTPLSDLTLDGFLLTEQAMINISGCLTTSSLLCAVAYSVADVTTSKFEKVEVPAGSGNCYWRPKTGVNRPIPICAVCRPTL